MNHLRRLVAASVAGMAVSVALTGVALAADPALDLDADVDVDASLLADVDATVDELVATDATVAVDATIVADGTVAADADVDLDTDVDLDAAVDVTIGSAPTVEAVADVTADATPGGDVTLTIGDGSQPLAEADVDLAIGGTDDGVDLAVLGRARISLIDVGDDRHVVDGDARLAALLGADGDVPDDLDAVLDLQLCLLLAILGDAGECSDGEATAIVGDDALVRADLVGTADGAMSTITPAGQAGGVLSGNACLSAAVLGDAHGCSAPVSPGSSGQDDANVTESGVAPNARVVMRNRVAVPAAGEDPRVTEVDQARAGNGGGSLPDTAATESVDAIVPWELLGLLLVGATVIARRRRLVR